MLMNEIFEVDKGMRDGHQREYIVLGATWLAVAMTLIRLLGHVLLIMFHTFFCLSGLAVASNSTRIHGAFERDPPTDVLLSSWMN